MTSPQAAAGTAVAASAAVDFASHAQALQSILADLGTVTVQQVVTLFRKYSDAADFPSLLKQALPEIVTPHAQAAAEITAQWYDELNPVSTFEATPVIDLAPERVGKSVDWALYAPGQATPLDRVAGSSKRMVSDASRDTVIANAADEGVKWARYASANACAFCRLLATRGAVYTEKGAAFKAHDHDRCLAVPERGGIYSPPDYVTQWEKDYRDARKDVRKSGQPMSTKNILASMRANTDAS
jgi:hypothetical protein